MTPHQQIMDWRRLARDARERAAGPFDQWTRTAGIYDGLADELQRKLDAISEPEIRGEEVIVI